jgi:hypothetical protein
METELVSASLFVPLIIVAITQMLKMALPQITHWVTILVAVGVGILVALVDGAIGVTDITIAQGLVFALEAIGITAIASKAGGGAKGDDSTPAR